MYSFPLSFSILTVGFACMRSFESSSEKSDRVSKACRQIQLAHHSKPAYLLNISVAYDILCQNKGDTTAGFTINVTVTVTEALVLRCILEDRGCITESIRILMPVDRVKQKCFQIMTKQVR